MELIWIAIAVVGYAYFMQSKGTASLPAALPSTNREVDITRWRHDGKQPMMWTNGNGMQHLDETVDTMYKKLS